MNDKIIYSFIQFIWCLLRRLKKGNLHFKMKEKLYNFVHGKLSMYFSMAFNG